MSTRGKPTSGGRSTQVAAAQYTAQIIGVPKKTGAQESKANIDIVKSIYPDWPVEDIARVLQDCNHDPQIAIERIADGTFGEPEPWGVVSKKKPKAPEAKSSKPKGQRDFSDRRDSSPRVPNGNQEGGSQRRQGGGRGTPRNDRFGGRPNEDASSQGIPKPLGDQTATGSAVTSNGDSMGSMTKSFAAMAMPADKKSQQPQSTSQVRPALNEQKPPAAVQADQRSGSTTGAKPAVPSYSSKLTQSLTPPPVQQAPPQKAAQRPPQQQQPTTTTQTETITSVTQLSSALPQTSLPQTTQSAAQATNLASSVTSTTSNTDNTAASPQSRAPYYPAAGKAWKPKDSKDAKDSSTSPSPPPVSTATTTQTQPQQTQVQAPKPAEQIQSQSAAQAPQQSAGQSAAVQPPIRAPTTYSPVNVSSSPVVLPASSLHAIDKLHREVTFGSHNFGQQQQTQQPAVELPSKVSKPANTTFAQTATSPAQLQAHPAQHQLPLQHQQIPQSHVDALSQGQAFDYQQHQDSHILEQEQGMPHPIPPYSYLPHGGPHMTHPYMPTHPFQAFPGYEADRQYGQPIYDPNFQGYPAQTQIGQAQTDTKFGAQGRTGAQPQGDLHQQTQQFAKYGAQPDTSATAQQTQQSQQQQLPGQTAQQTSAQQQAQAQQRQYAYPSMYYPPNYPQFLSYQIPQSSPQTYVGGYPKYYGSMNPNYPYSNPSGTSSTNVYAEDIPTHDFKHQAFPGMHTPFYGMQPEMSQQPQQPAKTSQPLQQQQASNPSKATQQYSSGPQATPDSYNKPQTMYNSGNRTDTSGATSSFYNHNQMPQYGQQQQAGPTSYSYNPHTMNQSAANYSSSTSTQRQQTYQS
eukprot:TRINITY_DN1373_c0_g1_i4.p1 TRINITY_DN1373_c0_g1~~TRINITY_DN1373_c0_g1_i4.p1  ORF type:complete len:853 (+),score=172.41 TRINITY_DN1373_c0_g1_i4:113-2671(+)